MALVFEVTKQLGRSVEQVKAKFADMHDALEYIELHVNKDHKTKVNSIYRLYRFGEILQEVDSTKQESLALQSEPSSGGTTTRSAFSPFATAPRPPGTSPPTQSHNLDIDDID